MPPRQPGCPRILACDLDGTLLNGKGVLTEATAAALRQAIARGVEVVFATGRRHSFAWTMLAPLGLDPETVLISSNGAITRTFGGRPMDRIGLPVETALQLCRQLNDFRNSLVFTFDRTGPGALVVEDIAALHARLSRWVEANLHELEAVLPLERAFDGGEEPVQAMICGTLAVMSEGLAVLDAPTEQAENLRKIISIHRTEYPARDLAIVDLMPNGCSKGSALARLAEHRGVDAAEIVAIGDNMNDAEMLAYAGRAVVMENSPAELLQMAAANGWSVAGSNESDGAAQAILRMLNTSATGDCLKDARHPAFSKLGFAWSMKITLTGRIQSGRNDASYWLQRFHAPYCQKTGMNIFPGSLNLELESSFDWYAKQYQSHIEWFGREEYGGERDILLLPCTLPKLEARPAFLWTTTTAAQDRPNMKFD